MAAAITVSTASAPQLSSIDFLHPFRLEFPVSLGIGRNLAASSEPLLLLRLIQPGGGLPRLGQPMPLMWQLVRGGSREEGEGGDDDEGEDDEVVRYEVRQGCLPREARGGWPAVADGAGALTTSPWAPRIGSGAAEAACWQIGGSGQGMVRGQGLWRNNPDANAGQSINTESSLLDPVPIAVSCPLCCCCDPHHSAAL